MTRRLAAAATGLTAALAALASGLGVFARGSGTYTSVVSARGETYEMAVDGVYAYSSKALVAEGIGWDVFTLLVVVPLLVVCAPSVLRGSLRAVLVAGGLLGYAAYMYLEYAVTWAFGPLFPLHIAVLAVSSVGLAAVGVEVARAAAGNPFERFPRRAYAAVTGTMAVLLTALWTVRIADGLAASVPELAGETTMTVQALDLGLVVPASAMLAIAVLRGSRAGELAAAGFAVLFVAMTAAIGSMMVSAWVVTGEPTTIPLVTFGAASMAGLIVARRIFASLSTYSHASPALRTSGAGAS